jgi:hypothetical protein
LSANTLHFPMPTTAEISAKANDERERCRAWLRTFMEHGQPKMATKEELWCVAKAELQVSRSSFDCGWGMAILDTGREDWFEPLRKRLRKNPQ